MEVPGLSGRHEEREDKKRWPERQTKEDEEELGVTRVGINSKAARVTGRFPRGTLRTSVGRLFR